MFLLPVFREGETEEVYLSLNQAKNAKIPIIPMWINILSIGDVSTELGLIVITLAKSVMNINTKIRTTPNKITLKKPLLLERICSYTVQNVI